MRKDWQLFFSLWGLQWPFHIYLLALLPALWKKIAEEARRADRVGSAFNLSCGKHGNKATVSKAEDFKLNAPSGKHKINYLSHSAFCAASLLQDLPGEKDQTTTLPPNATKHQIRSAQYWNDSIPNAWIYLQITNQNKSQLWEIKNNSYPFPSSPRKFISWIYMCHTKELGVLPWPH